MVDQMILQPPVGDDDGAAKWFHFVSKRLVDIGLKDVPMRIFIDEHGTPLMGLKVNAEEASRIRAALLH
jgi:hypothetical protein